MNKIKFYDENTRQWWTPNTGGANVPSLNDLLAPWGISFSDEVLEGELYISAVDGTLHYASGAGIHSFPANGFVVPATSLNDQGVLPYVIIMYPCVIMSLHCGIMYNY